MICDVVPWCGTDHEHTLGGDWEDAADGAAIRAHEHGTGYAYLLAVEQLTEDGLTVGVPSIAVDVSPHRLTIPEARQLAHDLLQLAATAEDGAR